jgi:hypothetical protein
MTADEPTVFAKPLGESTRPYVGLVEHGLFIGYNFEV